MHTKHAKPATAIDLSPVLPRARAYLCSVSATLAGPVCTETTYTTCPSRDRSW